MSLPWRDVQFLAVTAVVLAALASLLWPTLRALRSPAASAPPCGRCASGGGGCASQTDDTARSSTSAPNLVQLGGRPR